MKRMIGAVVVLSALSGCDGGAVAQAPPTGARPAVTTIATGLVAPWGIAFLPDGTALVTERGRYQYGRPVVPARILSVTPNGTKAEIMRLPVFRGPGKDGVRAFEEAGLLGIAVSPTYATDKWIYIYYTHTTTTNRLAPGATASDNRIARFRIGGRLEPILTGIPGGDYHDGGRIAFGPDGMLYAGTGETYFTREIAQDRDSLGGKILRMTPEGKPAPGNPFPDSVVWSLGHRNVQGLAFDPAGQLYASELGADRYDEINLIQAGKNYGWPVVEGPARDPRFVEPLATWTPTKIASPSGIAIRGDRIYVACLAGRRLYQVGLDGRAYEPLLVGEYGRLRAVATAPDGSLWILTSNRDGRGQPTPADDRILRLSP